MNLNTFQILIWTIISIVIFSGCGAPHKKSEAGLSIPDESVPIEETRTEDKVPTTVKPTGNPEKDWIFVEQAVDTWPYFHLSDFKTYEPLMRSTDYDSDRDIYIHHLRFRTMNEQGGSVTIEQDYEVDLNRPGDNGNPFLVKERPKDHSDR